MSPLQPRLSSVMGVARALLCTVSAEDTVEVLVSEFGWDISMQSLAQLTGALADEAFMLCWERLLTDSMGRELTDLGWQSGSTL